MCSPSSNEVSTKSDSANSYGRGSARFERSIRSRCRFVRFSPLLRAPRATTQQLDERRCTMIWHIFKKDWKLIWFFVAVVAALQAITELVLAKARVSDDSPMLTLLAQNLPA